MRDPLTSSIERAGPFTSHLRQRRPPASAFLLIITGLFAPVAAVVGYFVIALFFLLPIRVNRRSRRGIFQLLRA